MSIHPYLVFCENTWYQKIEEKFSQSQDTEPTLIVSLNSPIAQYVTIHGFISSNNAGDREVSKICAPVARSKTACPIING